MLKNLIILPDGTELFSGKGKKNAVMSATLTDCVNSGEELTLGSTCANMLEATIWTPGGGLSLTAGTELTLFKVDDIGARHKMGVFAIEKPTKPSNNTMRLTGYDRVTKLDKDLTSWLKALDGWPYTLLTFARMVCEACGLVLATDTIPNGSYLVNQFSKPGVTGRQLMQWVGEICCRFCRANADGEIEFAWYTPSGVSIGPSGENYYFSGGLSFEDYQVAPIEAVQLRLADSENGYLWPEAENGANTYIIAGNPLLSAATEDVLSRLEVIQAELAGFTYTPCKVSIPARLDVRAGQTVQVTDINGVTFTTYVMTKTQKGQMDTIVCSGSVRRDSTTAKNNETGTDLDEDTQLTQAEIFQILTNGGEIEGIFLKDGQLYINASYIVAGTLKSKDGLSWFNLDTGILGLMGEADAEGYASNLRLMSGCLWGDLYKDGENHGLAFSLAAAPYGALLRTWGDRSLYIGTGENPVHLRGSEIHIEGAPIYLGGKSLQWRTNPDDGFSYLVGVEVTE